MELVEGTRSGGPETARASASLTCARRRPDERPAQRPDGRPAQRPDGRPAQRPERSRLDVLTPYQLRVLQLMAQGMSNIAIAEQLGVSRRAIENQVSRLMQALGLGREDDAVAERVCAVLIYLADSGSTLPPRERRS
jgi:DNA-binding NarL/FixJ family response regulator